MKLIGVILILIGYSNAFSQKGFVSQFSNIIKDTANGFARYRGEEQWIRQNEAGKMGSFTSLQNLENTKENRIFYLGDSEKSAYAYLACIADSVGETDGKMICDLWMDQITSIMGTGFRIKKYETENGFSGAYGWKYQGEALGISIDMDAIGNTALKKISLKISYVITHKER